MTKREIIDEILILNQSAKPEFLAQFDCDELDAYLRHLQLAQTPRLAPTQGQYAKYFENVPTVKSDGTTPLHISADDSNVEDWEFSQQEPEVQYSEPMLFSEAYNDENTPQIAGAAHHNGNSDGHE